MNIEAWIALGTFAFVIGSAIVALAMRIATLQNEAKNQCERIDDEVDSRKEEDARLQKHIDEEEAERKKKDSDVLGEVKEQQKRFNRWERRQIDMGRRPPHDSDEGDT